MEFEITSRGDVSLIVFRPQNLEEANMYPGAMLAMNVPTDGAVDLTTLKTFLNQCLQRIGKQK